MDLTSCGSTLAFDPRSLSAQQRLSRLSSGILAVFDVVFDVTRLMDGLEKTRIQLG